VCYVVNTYIKQTIYFMILVVLFKSHKLTKWGVSYTIQVS